MQLAFRSYGSAGPALVILHGMFGSHENWHTMSSRLAKYRQVWALDQRNHGDSPHSSQMDYRAMAEDVRQFIEERSLGSVDLLGHSMGGKTAMQLALTDPASVQRLIVVDIAPRAYSPRHGQILQALLALKLEDFQSRKQIEDQLWPSVPDLGTRQFLLKNVKRDRHSRFQWKLGLREINDNYTRMVEAVASASNYSGPALFIRGEQSNYLTPHDLPGIQNLFPRAQLATIPGAGHLPHVENPGAFSETVCQFLQS
jgi:esterase